MSNVDNSLRDKLQKIASATNRPAPEAGPPPLPDGGDGGTYDGMDHDIHGRLSKLEGGNTVLQWSVATISAVLIGGLAIVAGLQVYTLGQVSALSTKVEELPRQISGDIQQLNQTLSQSITAARAVQAQPQVIIIPDRSEAVGSMPPLRQR